MDECRVAGEVLIVEGGYGVGPEVRLDGWCEGGLG